MKNRFIAIALCAVLLVSSAVCSEARQRRAFTGENWSRLNDQQKTEFVTSFVQKAKPKGVTIKKDQVFYAKKLDIFYAKNPKLKTKTVGAILKTLMIMEYDWDERGVDKDALAKAWLGEDLYKRNKARLGM